MIPIFGIDIGSFNLKGVELRKHRDKAYELITYGTAPSPINLAVSEGDSDLRALANSLKGFVKSFNFTTRDVVTALPESQIFTRVITLPKMSPRELTKSLEWEAEQYIPMPLEQVSLDYQILHRSSQKQETDKSMDVLLVAAPKRLVNKYLRVLQWAGLNPLAVETETTAVVRSAIGSSSELPATIIISIGAGATDLSIVSVGIVKFTRSIPTGGKALARAISQELGFEMDQAEEYKKSYGLEQFQLEGKIMGAIKPIFDVIVSEIKRALAFYSSRFTGDPVKRAVLVGGTASLPGIVVYLASALNLEVQLANPWQSIRIPKKFTQEQLDDIAPSFAVAVGLAMKEIE